MLKIVSTGMTALVISITGSGLGYAQNFPAALSSQRATVADLNTLTDARIDVVKAALQLTPEQEKSWPAIEDAIRSRAKERQNRLQGATARADERSERSSIEVLRDRNPIEFLNRRSDGLAQRAADLKKLAAAWQPLYATLTPDQKRRLGLVALVALRELRSAAEQRRIRSTDDED
jgi:LTXXQ motif family protein